jgi:peptidoglycan-associated lipoprotein
MIAHRFILLGLFALAAAGCGGNRSNTIPDTSVDGIGGSDPGSTTSVGDGGFGAFEPLDGAGSSATPPSGLMDQLVVYFEFDSSDIRSDFNTMLAAHGDYLASNPRAQVRLEGHADERGSREYNIGLGERRAQAVRRILLLQGATADQLSTVSYGEERPAVGGSDEESYALNRRVELVYR